MTYDEDPAVTAWRNVFEESDLLLHEVAEKHLAACNNYLFYTEDPWSDPDVEPPEDVAFGPYCGCDTCVVREVLTAVYYHVHPNAVVNLLQREWD